MPHIETPFSMLRYAHTTPEVYKALQQIPRTGWVIRNVPNPETVYDHTVALITLAVDLASELALTQEELDDLTHILEIHDWAEALVGDEYIPNTNHDTYQARKIRKTEREAQALKELLSGKTFGPTVQHLWERYEQGTDAIAKLAKELDKFQALQLAGEYQTQYDIPLFDEFDAHYEREHAFTHPLLLQKVSELRKRYTRHNKSSPT